MDLRYGKYGKTKLDIPVRYPQQIQLYRGTPQNPYPMNFMQAPSFDHQVLVDYRGQAMLQGLSTVRGPFMFPVRNPYGNRCNFPPPDYYNVLDPFQMSYVNLVDRGYVTRRPL